MGDPAAGRDLKVACQRQRHIFTPRSGHDLDADGQSFRGGSTTHHCCRPAYEIVDVGVAEVC